MGIFKLSASIVFMIGILLCAFWMFPLEIEKKSVIVLLLLLATTFMLSFFLDSLLVSWLIMLVITDLYILFYTKDHFYFLCYTLLQLFLFIVLYTLLWMNGKEALLVILFLPLTYLLVLTLQKRRKMAVAAGILLLTATFFYLGLEGYELVMQIAALVLVFQSETLFQNFSKNVLKNKEEFQNRLMVHHYEEVKSVYLNMRGWRHDYHNHIQSIKAYLALEEYNRLSVYLCELDRDLSKVDQLVKSGNLMVDAVLNSKLTLAGAREIPVTCKINVPEVIRISDLDLCVMLGNLLDNAMEACGDVEREKRFLRIYGDVIQSQFYFSVLNSAVEELGFNQKSYISEKRGEHGYGIKRVKITVDKYEGYLNLKNETGVFASEIMIPL